MNLTVIEQASGKLIVTETPSTLVVSESPTKLSIQSDGAQGPVGQGFPPGGTYGQVIVKDSSTDYDATWRDGDIVTTVRNATGSTLTKGTVVYINGMQGNRPTVAKAQANTESTSSKTYGLIALDLPDNSDGPVVHLGLARNLDTQGITEGVPLYLSPTVAGGYTTVKPSAPNHMVSLGVCTRAHPTLGTIQVTVQNGFELQELHNVALSSVADGQLLTYESATSLWKNKNLSLPDATASVKGVIRLTGDLDGTADSPSVPGLLTKEPLIAAGTQAQYWRGDKSWQNLNKNAVGLENVDNTSDISKPVSTATQAALNAKENLSNKSTNTALGTSDDLYPSQKAVKTYVDNQITGSATPDATDLVKGKIRLAGDLAGSADNPTVPGLASKEPTIAGGTVSQYWRGDKTFQTLDKAAVDLANVDNTSDLLKPLSNAAVSALAGKEDVANKSTNTALGTSDTLYPTQNAVKSYVDAQVSGGTPDATTTTKGKIQLAGDLSGTAAAPTVPALANKEDTANKSNNTALGTSATLYPTQNAVKTYTDSQALISALIFG